MVAACVTSNGVMGRDGRPPPHQDVVTVGEAAALWGVGRNTVYYWIKTGVLRCFDPNARGELTADRQAVLAAKVFLGRRVRRRGPAPALIARAQREGIVGHDDERLSLNDLNAFGLSDGDDDRDDADRPPRRHSGTMPKVVDHLKALEQLREQEQAWVERGADPCERPDEYFDTHDPPEVIAPEGVFRYTLEGPVPGQLDKRYVGRSAGYERVDGKLVWFDANDHFAVVGAKEPLCREWNHSNHLHRLAVERSHREWRRRGLWLRSRSP
ncbi:MAG: helix-turn-helix domain-containing protein [Polyangiaceae bacterium]|jgi:hypothetical protein